MLVLVGILRSGERTAAFQFTFAPPWSKVFFSLANFKYYRSSLYYTCFFENFNTNIVFFYKFF